MRGKRGALILVVATGVSLSAAPPAARERSLADLAEAYRTVDRVKAVAAVALWDRDKLETEVRRLLEGTGSAPALVGEATLLAAVALLAESGLLDVDVGDAERGRWELQNAARLMQAAPPRTVFARRFYLLAGLALHRAVELQAAHGLLVQALRVENDDPELLTALGAITETVAALRQYERSPDSRDRSLPQLRGYSAEGGGGGSLPSASLAEAESRYEKALALDPGLVEARLRLGRVRLLRGHPDAALRDLEWVATQARQSDRRYLARLFEGRTREALGDVRGAAVAYRAATAHVPQAQTGLLALGRILDSVGDATGAQEALERASAPGGSQDPWWNYQMGQPQRLDGLLDELRRLVP